jgi:penicillin-binding protein 1C
LLKVSQEESTGFTNIASVAVENRTGEVGVWIGSQDFFNDYINGQVDGVLARRPAAGMLQPFLYALSLDKELLLPDSEILDSPEKFQNYIPTNRDGKFMGSISISEALKSHRTVPAVKVLDAYGIEEFFTFLKVAGLKTLNYPPQWYSYSLVSGGTDVRLIDLAKLYSGLARYGKFSTLSLEGKRQKLPTDAKQLITPRSSWTVLEKMMTQVEIDGRKAVVSSTCTRRKKDCWVVAVTPKWTVAYWGGNLNGNKSDTEKDLKYLNKLTFSTLSYLPEEDDIWFENPEKSID